MFLLFTVYTLHKNDQEAPLYSEPLKIGRVGYAINIKYSCVKDTLTKATKSFLFYVHLFMVLKKVQSCRYFCDKDRLK